MGDRKGQQVVELEKGWSYMEASPGPSLQGQMGSMSGVVIPLVRAPAFFSLQASERHVAAYVQEGIMKLKRILEGEREVRPCMLRGLLALPAAG